MKIAPNRCRTGKATVAILVSLFLKHGLKTYCVQKDRLRTLLIKCGRSGSVFLLLPGDLNAGGSKHFTSKAPCLVHCSISNGQKSAKCTGYSTITKLIHRNLSIQFSINASVKCYVILNLLLSLNNILTSFHVDNYRCTQSLLMAKSNFTASLYP